MEKESSTHIRLNDFVSAREVDKRYNPFKRSHFGLDRVGRFINQWTMNFNKIGFSYNTFNIENYGGGNHVEIIVPPTESGIRPLTESEQPYGWDGKINEFAAECAVWLAFEILDDREGTLFLKEQRPAVIFRFFEDATMRELHARYDGSVWSVMDYL